MDLLEQYKSSLKMPEAEEVLDLVVYRPAAFVVIKTIYRSPITPNQVSFTALVAGLFSAWYLSLGTPLSYLIASAFYFVANVLDCSDGQLARLQQSGTPLGRLIDGLVDYVISVAIFAGIGIGLDAGGHPMWLAVVAAGITSMLHAIVFDHYQGEYILIARGGINSRDEEFETIALKVRNRGTKQYSFFTRLLLRAYLSYLTVQRKLVPTRAGPSPDRFRSENKIMIRLWSYLGPTTNRTALIICAALGRVDMYLWAIIIIGNLWLGYCMFMQRWVDIRLGRGRA